MQELLCLLQEAGGLKLEIREHELWRQTQLLKEAGKIKMPITIVGQFQIIASSGLGEISIIQSVDVMTSKLRFEVCRLKGGARDGGGDTDKYWDRRACCRRVCLALAPVSRQVAERWREKHGKST